MAAEIIGSVGVRQAATTMDEIKFKLGKTINMIAASKIGCQINAITQREREHTRDDKPTKCHSGDDHE